HSPAFVQLPNISRSIAATMLRARAERSGRPCGRSPRCDTFAAVNSMAAAFGHAATQAPQPMHVAASKARSASSLRTRMALASGAEPVGALMKPPAWTIRSKALRSTIRSLMTGNARSEEHTSELQSRFDLVCRLLLEKKKKKKKNNKRNKNKYNYLC